jgi:hypothetical protein
MLLCFLVLLPCGEHRVHPDSMGVLQAPVKILNQRGDTCEQPNTAETKAHG